MSGFGRMPQRVEVSGFVVARDKLILFANAANKDKPQTERFIVRLEKHESLAKESLYIQVYYRWQVDQPLLPSEFFKSSKLWRFILARVPSCDGTIKKMVTTYNEKGEPSPFSVENLPIRLDGARDEQIPLEKVLPCYVLEPDNIKSLKLEN
jgi:hypothetical protein